MNVKVAPYGWLVGRGDKFHRADSCRILPGSVLNEARPIAHGQRYVRMLPARLLLGTHSHFADILRIHRSSIEKKQLEAVSDTFSGSRKASQ